MNAVEHLERARRVFRDLVDGVHSGREFRFALDVETGRGLMDEGALNRKVVAIEWFKCDYELIPFRALVMAFEGGATWSHAITNDGKHHHSTFDLPRVGLLAAKV